MVFVKYGLVMRPYLDIIDDEVGIHCTRGRNVIDVNFASARSTGVRDRPCLF